MRITYATIEGDVKRSQLIDVFLQLRPMFRLFLRNRMRSDVSVEDILQDSFIKLSELPADFRCRDPRAYLFRMIRNSAVDFMRYEALRRGRPLSDQAVSIVPANEPTPEVAAFASDWYRRFHVVLDAMPTRQREIFILHKMRHLSYREIADLLNISPKRVEKHMGKALSFCRLRLGAVLDDMNISGRS